MRWTENARATPSITATSAAALRHGWWRSSGHDSWRSKRDHATIPVGVSVTLRSARAAAARECVASRQAAPCSRTCSTSSDEHALGGGRVEIAGRLVGEDELRPVHEGPRDRDALQLAARERVRQARLEAGEADRRQHGGDAHRIGGVLQQQRQADVGGHGQVRQDVERLEHEAEVMAPEHALAPIRRAHGCRCRRRAPGRRRWCRGRRRS